MTTTSPSDSSEYSGDGPYHGDDTLNLGIAGYFALILVGAVVVLIVVIIGCTYMR